MNVPQAHPAPARRRLPERGDRHRGARGAPPQGARGARHERARPRTGGVTPRRRRSMAGPRGAASGRPRPRAEPKHHVVSSTTSASCGTSCAAWSTSGCRLTVVPASTTAGRCAGPPARTASSSPTVPVRSPRRLHLRRRRHPGPRRQAAPSSASASGHQLLRARAGREDLQAQKFRTPRRQPAR